jgi:hypothetical protein
MNAGRKNVEQGVIEKEPLVTGHPSHGELIEELRINRAGRSMHRMPLYPQALIYIFAIVAIACAAFYWML